MDRPGRRSAHVTQATAPPPPTVASQGFEALYREAADDVHAYVHALLRDRTAAEDVTAAAFERAYRRWGRYDPRRGSPRQWLFGIARNAALDELRRRGRQARLAGEPTAPPADDEEPGAERRARVAAAWATLDGADRELLALKFHGGLSHAEIGGVLGISPTNAGTRLHRALTRLRKACA